MTTTENITRDSAIAAIRTALKKRSGKAWSVTGGRGTAWGWLTIDAPPARRTWAHRPKDGMGDCPPPGAEYWEEHDTGTAGRSMGPADRAELAGLLAVPESQVNGGASIPASSGHWLEYIDRANGIAPRVIGKQYWD